MLLTRQHWEGEKSGASFLATKFQGGLRYSMSCTWLYPHGI
jgi:hypothetical protein